MKGLFAAMNMAFAVTAVRHRSDPDLAACNGAPNPSACSAAIAHAIVGQSNQCFKDHVGDEVGYHACTAQFCAKQCGTGSNAGGCKELCGKHADALFQTFSRSNPGGAAQKQKLQAEAQEAAAEQIDALADLQKAHGRLARLNSKIAQRAQEEMRTGDSARAKADFSKAKRLVDIQDKINEHLAKVQGLQRMAKSQNQPEPQAQAFLQRSVHSSHQTPTTAESELANEMTHDLEMNFNKIAPFGKEDTAKELQDHAAKTQDTLVDAVENAEVAEIKRAVFRALTRLRAATIKEFDTIARLETQAIDAYNDAHHYRGENPLAHLHEDEAPVETDKLKSFH